MYSVSGAIRYDKSLFTFVSCSNANYYIDSKGDIVFTSTLSGVTNKVISVKFRANKAGTAKVVAHSVTATNESSKTLSSLASKVVTTTIK